MDLVMNRVGQVSHKNWGKECILCSSRHGVPIECSARGCKAAYHTTCAIRAKLKMQAIFGKNYKGGIKLRSYCKDHTPQPADINSEQQDVLNSNGAHEIDMTNMADDRLQENPEELDHFWKYVDLSLVQKHVLKSLATTSKSASTSTATTPTHTPVPMTPTPATPSSPSTSREIVCGATEQQLMIDLIYRYWILLRTSNHGQSLIKFSPKALREREIEQRKNILRLRIELERIRNLSYMIGKREKIKLAWLKSHTTIVKRTLGVIDELIPAIPEEMSPQSSNASLPIDVDKLIDDLVGCDMIYQSPDLKKSITADTLPERRRTLSLARRINHHLKTIPIHAGPNLCVKKVQKRGSNMTSTTTTVASTSNGPKTSK